MNLLDNTNQQQSRAKNLTTPDGCCIRYFQVAATGEYHTEVGRPRLNELLLGSRGPMLYLLRHEHYINQAPMRHSVLSPTPLEPPKVLFDNKTTYSK